MAARQVNSDVIIGHDGEPAWAGAGDTAPGRHHDQGSVTRIFTLSPDPIAVVGSDGYFVRVNPAAADLLGYTVAELPSRPVFDFIHPEDHGRSLTAGQSLHDVVVGFENRYVCKDGSLKWLARTVIRSVIAAFGEHPFPAGSTWSLDDPSAMATVARTRRAARIDDVSALNGEIACIARDAGFTSTRGLHGAASQAPRSTSHMNRDWFARSSTGDPTTSARPLPRTSYPGRPGLHLMDATSSHSNVWRTV